MNRRTVRSGSISFIISFDRIALVACCLAVFLGARPASAAMFTGISGDGDPISATADFSLVGDTLTVKLTNTTTFTHSADELFTGIDFSLSGLSPTLPSLSVTGILRDIAGSGSFTDGGVAVPLSWELISIDDDCWQLNFHPNAKNAIVGPPSGGNYAGSNGSIKGNPGHNPYAAEMAVAVFDVPGLSSQPLPQVVVKAFRFGTELVPGDPGPDGGITPGGGPEVPEPASWTLAALGFLLLALRRP